MTIEVQLQVFSHYSGREFPIYDDLSQKIAEFSLKYLMFCAELSSFIQNKFKKRSFETTTFSNQVIETFKSISFVHFDEGILCLNFGENKVILRKLSNHKILDTLHDPEFWDTYNLKDVIYAIFDDIIVGQKINGCYLNKPFDTEWEADYCLKNWTEKPLKMQKFINHWGVQKYFVSHAGTPFFITDKEYVKKAEDSVEFNEALLGEEGLKRLSIINLICTVIDKVEIAPSGLYIDSKDESLNSLSCWMSQDIPYIDHDLKELCIKKNKEIDEKLLFGQCYYKTIKSAVLERQEYVWNTRATCFELLMRNLRFV